MLKGVIFDVDGTLLDTERIYMGAWKQAAEEAGYDLPDDVLLKTRAISRDIANRIFKEAMGEDFSYMDLYPRRLAIAEEMIAMTRDILKPGAGEALKYLRREGIPMAVASSTNTEKTVAHLEHAGLLDFFDAVVGGDMVEKGKPAPDIFLKDADMLGLEPEACMAVEDSPAGIRAAAAAGMMPVLIPDCVPATPETAALSIAVLQSMHQLIGLLERFGQ